MSWGRIKIDKADRAFSLYIRTKADFTCERCQRKADCEASHFFGRRSESTRYDIENVFCLCSGCHRFFTENPNTHRDWVYNKLGTDRFAALVVRNNTYQKKDRKLAYIISKKLYLDLCVSKGIEPRKV